MQTFVWLAAGKICVNTKCQTALSLFFQSWGPISIYVVLGCENARGHFAFIGSDLQGALPYLMCYAGNYLLSFVFLVGILLIDWGISLTAEMIREYMAERKRQREFEDNELLLSVQPDQPLTSSESVHTLLAGL